jgi:beta-xylosidase
MKDDFSDIQPETLQECISATAPWENTDSVRWPVTEGPTVLKHKNRYYLFYSANDFRNIHYAVGYAVATTPYGPWKKYSGNPIISSHNVGHNGTGHGDFIKDKKGNLYYVLHTHRSNKVVSPRLTAIVRAKFMKDDSSIDRMEIVPGSFHYLSLSHMAK